MKRHSTLFCSDKTGQEKRSKPLSEEDIFSSILHEDKNSLYLNLGLNNLSTNATELAAYLKTKLETSSVQSLTMEGHFFYDSMMPIAEGIKTNNSFTTITLCRMSMSIRSWTCLGKALKNKNLSSFVILKSDFTGMTDFPDAYFFKINDCKMTDKDALSLFQGMKENRDFPVLIDLANNLITDKSCPHIGRMLENNVFHTLYLGNNYITSKGASDLATALLKNTSLTTLGLNGTCIGNKGANQLAEALKSNASLQIMHLNNAYITSKGYNNLISTINDFNTKILSISLSNEQGQDTFQTFSAEKQIENTNVSYMRPR